MTSYNLTVFDGSCSHITLNHISAPWPVLSGFCRVDYTVGLARGFPWSDYVYNQLNVDNCLYVGQEDGLLYWMDDDPSKTPNETEVYVYNP
jgi:hypothetical protein